MWNAIKDEGTLHQSGVQEFDENCMASVVGDALSIVIKSMFFVLGVEVCNNLVV